jgi:Zn-dependent protease
MPTRSGSFRLFQCFGIEVFLHWSWFIVAVYEIQIRKGNYSSINWNILEYLSLFLIVLLHEFGHALACRSVGGQANQIVLWPFGGVAYVSPPQRPGAQLWSIVAGPLVNVVLVPILSLIWWLGNSAGWENTNPNLATYVETVWYINLILLLFNMLPVYPLDGGQILRSLLWFIFGRAHSLQIATVIGFVGAAGLVAVAIWLQSVWLGMLCCLNFFYCYQSFKQARALLVLDRAPRNENYHCPRCHAAPPVGDFWRCGNCRKGFNTFATHAVCPHCGKTFDRTACPACGLSNPIADWASPAPSVTS